MFQLLNLSLFLGFLEIPRKKNVLADCLAKDASTASGTLVVGDAFITPN